MTTEFNEMRGKLQTVNQNNLILKTRLEETVASIKQEKVDIMKVINE